MKIYLPKLKLKDICIIALLGAIYAVLSQLLPIRITDSIKFTLSFLAVTVGASLYGIKGGLLVGALGDAIGGIFLATGGAYFPGFTLSAAITGAIYGLFLAGRKYRFIYSLAAVLISQIASSLLLNSIFISVMYGTDFLIQLKLRLIQCAVMIPIQTIAVHLFMKLAFQKIKKQI